MLSVIALVAAATWTCDQEQARITRHLEDALIQLQTATPEGLQAGQLAKRREVLGLLRRYIDEGRFPRSEGPTAPVFVDHAGRHCAMGALISWTGGEAMVEHIRTTRNLATVPTLADEPGLMEWLTAHGLTPEEAALVQPTYFVCEPAIDACLKYPGPQSVFELANGEFQPDGGETPFRVARSDASRQVCEGDVVEGAGGVGWGTELIPPRARIWRMRYRRQFVRSTRGWVPLEWARCPNPPTFAEADLLAPTFGECARALIAADERALLPTCHHEGIGQNAWSLCDDTGRIIDDQLPYGADGIEGMRIWILNHQSELADSGVSLEPVNRLLAEARAHSGATGVPLDGSLPDFVLWEERTDVACQALRDGGALGAELEPASVQGRAPAGCQAVPTGAIPAAVALALVLTRRRNRPVPR
ncbi:MAG: hypothetical protein AB1938_16300 [Myxococcota bacterium]